MQQRTVAGEGWGSFAPLRAAAGRTTRGPVRRIRRMGGIALLAWKCVRALLTWPSEWRGELARSLIRTVRTTLPPIAIAVSAWGFSGPGLQAGNFLVTFGSIDRSGGFMVVAIMREFGTFVTATVVAGVAGTMLTAELGTRKIRGELDALGTLGIDPIKSLVAPRILAFAIAMAALDIAALFFGVLGGFLATTFVLGGTDGAFIASFFANTTLADLIASVVKVSIFGVLIGVISAYHGLVVSGGAEGVGRAVNRAVVGSLVAIFFVNLVFTQWFLAEFPETAVFR